MTVDCFVFCFYFGLGSLIETLHDYETWPRSNSKVTHEIWQGMLGESVIVVARRKIKTFSVCDVSVYKELLL